MRRFEFREIPMPRVCPDCFHEECLALFDAWKLLDAAERVDAGWVTREQG